MTKTKSVNDLLHCR